MSIEAMKQRLEELEKIHSDPMLWRSRRSKINFLRQAIAEAEKQEPVAYWNINNGFSHCMIDQLNEAAKHNPAPLYTHPPKREWVSLTDDEIADIANGCRWSDTYHFDFAKAIDAKLRENNT